jgi:hypothetical protein
VAIATYDPLKIVVTFGPLILSGYADGSFLTIDRTTDSFALIVGSSGEQARSRSNDRSAIATLKLLQTSLANDALSLQLQADELNGSGISPFMVKDLRGNSLTLAKEAWIIKPPTQDFDRTIGPREWNIQLAEALVIVAGNI